MLDGNENEKRIVRDAISGEASAFGLLYDKYQPKIYRFILFKVSHREEAEDLTHQVFLSAWKNINNFEEKGLPFSSWLFRIARNKVIDYYRIKKNIVSIDDKESFKEEAVESDLEKIAKELQLEKIYRALEELTEEQREVIILRFVEGLSHKEISKIMNKNQGAIRVLQHRATSKIKKIIEENEK